MFISFLCTCHNVKHTAGFLCVCYWKYVPLAVISAFIRFSLNLSPWAFCSVLYLDILSFFEIMKKPRAWISFHLVKTKVLLKKWHHSFWLMSPILKPSFIEQKYHELLKLHHIRGFTTYAHVFCLIGPLWQRQAVERCYVNIFPQRPIWHLWSTWAVYGEQTDLGKTSIPSDLMRRVRITRADFRLLILTNPCPTCVRFPSSSSQSLLVKLCYWKIA